MKTNRAQPLGDFIGKAPGDFIGKSPGDFIEDVIDIAQVISEAFRYIRSDILLMSYTKIGGTGKESGILVYLRGTGGYACDLTGVCSLDFKELPPLKK